MDTILERIKAIKAQMNEIEKRIIEDSLTIEEVKTLDDEWEVLDAELSMYDDVLYTEQLAEQAELEMAQPEQQEENPPDWLVEQWEEERANWGRYSLSPTFNLADEV